MLSEKKSRFSLAAGLFLMLALSGCVKEEKVRPPIVDESDPEISITAPEAPLPKWLPDDTPHIALVFGCGYETEEERQPVIDFINDEYGMASDGGLFELYSFPEEYLNGKRIRVAFLTNTFKNKSLNGIILLGAPDRTYFALSDLMESGNSIPVWSVFPVIYTEDEILGTENASFFVLSYKGLSREKTDSDAKIMKEMTEETGFKGNIADVLRPVVKYIKKSGESSNSPYSPADAAGYLLKSYSGSFSECTLERYIEGQSGIPAQNHYVLGVWE